MLTVNSRRVLGDCLFDTDFQRSAECHIIRLSPMVDSFDGYGKTTHCLLAILGVGCRQRETLISSFDIDGFWACL
jgi:hypothetical protein